MDELERTLVPRPSVIREELARNYSEARFLRRLLKLAVDAAAEAPKPRRRSPAALQTEAVRRPGGGAP
jgi:hypothetical protein